MPAGEGLRSPLKAQPCSGPRRLSGAGCRSDRSIPGGPGSVCSEPLQRVAPPAAARGQPRDPAPLRGCGISAERGGFGAALKSPRYEIVFALAAGIPALHVTLMRFKAAIGLTAAQKSASH